MFSNRCFFILLNTFDFFVSPPEELANVNAGESSGKPSPAGETGAGPNGLNISASALSRRRVLTYSV